LAISGAKRGIWGSEKGFALALKFVTTARAAEMLGVRRKTIYKYIDLGLLETGKPRGVLLVIEDSIHRLIERSMTS
jgi:predicted DNA-binding transcriptional regulator YafY